MYGYNRYRPIVRSAARAVDCHLPMQRRGDIYRPACEMVMVRVADLLEAIREYRPSKADCGRYERVITVQRAFQHPFASLSSHAGTLTIWAEMSSRVVEVPVTGGKLPDVSLRLKPFLGLVDMLAGLGSGSVTLDVLEGRLIVRYEDNFVARIEAMRGVGERPENPKYERVADSKARKPVYGFNPAFPVKRMTGKEKIRVSHMGEGVGE